MCLEDSCELSVWRMYSGKLFLNAGSDTEKARLPSQHKSANAFQLIHTAQSAGSSSNLTQDHWFCIGKMERSHKVALHLYNYKQPWL